MTIGARRTTGKAALVVAAACVAAAVGCTGLGGLSGGAPAGADAAVIPDSATPDGATPDTSPCGDTSRDPANCGRCGHDCLGGACSEGTCEPVSLGTVGLVPLARILLSATHIFVLAQVVNVPDIGGIWRIPKAGGAPERLVSLRLAEEMAILGDTLYFVVDDLPADGSGQTGGIYTCPVNAPAPCTPQLVAPADRPTAIAIDQGRVFFSDAAGVELYVPPMPPTSFSLQGSLAVGVYVDGPSLFFTSAGSAAADPRRARLSTVAADGTALELFGYTEMDSACGLLHTTPDAFYFAAFDAQTTTGGIVRRIPRTNATTPCDLGGSGNLRPYGVHTDEARVYWTNQGIGARPPFTNGSIASCPLTGCCPTPTVHWKGQGQPTAITGDATALYFTTHADGFVWRLAKP